MLKTSVTLILGHFFSSYEDIWEEKLACVLISSAFHGMNKKSQHV